MIKRLLSGQINSITIAALLVALSSLVSRFLGIFRDRILAGQFGAGDTLDVYYAAFRIPDLIFNLLVLGALSAGFIPIFVELLKQPLDKLKSGLGGEKFSSAWKLANNVINVMGLALIVLSLIGIVFAPGIMKLIVPGFSPEKRALAAGLTRIMFLSPIFLGLSSVLGGILQSFKRFFVYSLSPIVYNIGIIIGALYFVPIWGVFGLAWGVVLGAFLHMVVQLPMAYKLGFRYRPLFNLRSGNLRHIAVMMIPRTLSLAISQINLLVITVIASTLMSGSLTVFNLANNLQSFPIGIFGISFAVAAFPTLAGMAFDKSKLISSFSRVFRQIMFFIVPSTVLLITLRAQIIRVILGTGRFDWEDTIMTINTLSYFTLSLFAQASLPLLTRVFYARRNATTPFYVGLVSIIINIGLSLWLPRIVVCQQFGGSGVDTCAPLGVAGLALAFSISSIINFFILWIILHLELGSLEESRVLVSAAKFSGAALALGITVQSIELLVLPFVDMTRLWGVLTQGLCAGGTGILVYLAFCSLFRSEELFSFWESLKRRLPWKKISTGDQGEARGI